MRHYNKIWVFCVMLCLLLGSVSGPAYASAVGPGMNSRSQKELRGVWISYLDWEEMPSDFEAFKNHVDAMMDRCVNLHMNAVFVHVRPDADAMYPSEYFPWSRFVTGTQGQDPGYDPLAYLIQSAHARGLQFHAWVNPFRVTGYHNTWEQVSQNHPAKQWLSDEDPSNDRFVLFQDGNYYLNPAVLQVQELIVNGVLEIVERYEVDGIHFDDYFYPQVADEDPNRWFDRPEYEASKSSRSIGDWRRENVSSLVRQVYEGIKERKPQVQFGISPEGYLKHLRGEERLFTDVDLWIREEGYIDYIMPQIYWGFEQKTADKSPAPFAFSPNLKAWTELTKNSHVRLYLGLAMYKTGTDTADHNEISEWIRYDDIMKRQVEAGRATGLVDGYCFYAYRSFQESNRQKEVEHLLEVLD